MKHIITLDVGTTSVKTALFTRAFDMVRSSSREYELLTPASDIVELDPEMYWRSVQDGIRDITVHSGVNPDDIAAICCTTQGETLIPVDAEGRVLHNALVWIDARARAESEYLKEKIPNDIFYQTTGIPEIGPSCPLSKVLWFKRNRADIFGKTAYFLLLEDFLIHRLTGLFVTNPSLLSSTGYFDICKNVLWERALDAIDINEKYFPKITACGSIAGTLRPPVASDLGLHSATAVVTGAMDQIASAIGAGNIQPGMVTETTGTALVIGATMDTFDAACSGGVSVYRHYDRRFLMLPYCTTAGIVLKWFRDEFCTEEQTQASVTGVSAYDLLDTLAQGVAPGCGGLLLVPNFAGKQDPAINTAAKGVFFGVGLESQKAHFVRAIFEGVAFMLRENIEHIEKTGVAVKEIRSLGGGSKGRIWNEIKADVCGKDMITMNQTESTSLGAAILGMVALGDYPSVDAACVAACRVKNTYHPDVNNRKVYDTAYAKSLAVYRQLKELF